MRQKLSPQENHPPSQVSPIQTPPKQPGQVSPIQTPNPNKPPSMVSPIQTPPKEPNKPPSMVSPIQTPPKEPNKPPSQVSPIQTPPNPNYQPPMVSPIQTPNPNYQPPMVSPIQTPNPNYQPPMVSPIQTPPNPNYQPPMVSPIQTPPKQPGYQMPAEASKHPCFTPEMMEGAMACQMTYPEIYYILQPHIMMACDEMEMCGNMMPTKKMMMCMANRVHENAARMSPEYAKYTGTSGMRAMVDGFVGGPIADIIGILLLGELFRRRRRFY